VLEGEIREQAYIYFKKKKKQTKYAIWLEQDGYNGTGTFRL
jgi:hypothetical protein